MNKLKLGYTEKWFDYEFLNEEIMTNQISEFENGGDQNMEHYRYTSFVNWLEKKDVLSNQDVKNYIELAQEDTDARMAGSAIKNLFVSTKISDEQFELIKIKLPQFGEWTQKLITREVLTKRLKNEELTPELFDLCYKYKKDFDDNRLLINIIQKTEKTEFLSRFLNLDIGKKIKTLATNKLNKLGKP